MRLSKKKRNRPFQRYFVIFLFYSNSGFFPLNRLCCPEGEIIIPTCKNVDMFDILSKYTIYEFFNAITRHENIYCNLIYMIGNMERKLTNNYNFNISTCIMVIIARTCCRFLIIRVNDAQKQCLRRKRN